MNCAECRDNLVACLEGLLEPEQSRQCRAHLESCAACRAEYAVLSRLQERLVAGGRVSDLVQFDVKGWELIVAGVDASALGRLSVRPTKVTEIAGGRYSVELPGGAAPDRVLSELTAAGGKLVSLNPIRDTLEDFFVRQVTAAGEAAPEASSCE